MEQMYVEIKNSHDIDTQNEWFRKCTECGIPYIYIIKRAKFADIHWDCISIDPDRDAAVYDNNALNMYLNGVFNTVANKSSKYEMSSFVGWFNKIPVEHAEKAAIAIFIGLSREIKNHQVMV
jgi:hypothetical protein